jgi:hypothetical protein
MQPLKSYGSKSRYGFRYINMIVTINKSMQLDLDIPVIVSEQEKDIDWIPERLLIK